MHFELKQLKIVKSLSEETACFTATLWADGKKVALVSNRGTGGCNDWRWLDRTAQQAFAEQAKAAFPEETYEQDDALVGRMISRIKHIAWLKRGGKTALWFRLRGDARGSWRTLKGGTTTSRREYIRQKHGDTVEMVANDDIEAAADFDLGQ